MINLPKSDLQSYRSVMLRMIADKNYLHMYSYLNALLYYSDISSNISFRKAFGTSPSTIERWRNRTLIPSDILHIRILQFWIAEINTALESAK